MAIRKYKPVTPSRRHMSGSDFDTVTSKKPHKSLTKSLKSKGGRSSTTGKITVHHRGAGHKRKYRMIDFNQRGKLNIPGTIEFHHE